MWPALCSFGPGPDPGFGHDPRQATRRQGQRCPPLRPDRGRPRALGQGQAIGQSATNSIRRFIDHTAVRSRNRRADAGQRHVGARVGSAPTEATGQPRGAPDTTGPCNAGPAHGQENREGNDRDRWPHRPARHDTKIRACPSAQFSRSGTQPRLPRRVGDYRQGGSHAGRGGNPSRNRRVAACGPFMARGTGLSRFGRRILPGSPQSRRRRCALCAVAPT